MPLSGIARAYSHDTLEIFKRIFLFNFSMQTLPLHAIMTSSNDTCKETCLCMNEFLDK
jgi:hypothetical protein